MSLVSRLSDLVKISAPIQLNEDLPPFWIKKEDSQAIALFESLTDFEDFHKYVPVFAGFEYIEVDEWGTVRIHMGYVQ